MAPIGLGKRNPLREALKGLVCWVFLTFLFVIPTPVWLAGCSLFPSPRPPLTEEEASAILEIQSAGGRLYDQLVREGLPQAAEVVAEWLRGLPAVRTVELDDDGVIWVDYRSGVVGAFYPTVSRVLSVKGSKGSLERERRLTSNPSVVPPLDTTLHARVPANTKVAVYVFPEFVDDYENLYRDLFAATLESLGYSVSYFEGTAFTLESVKHSSEYGIIFFLTHGSACKRTHRTAFATGQEACLTDVLRAAWKREVGLVSVGGGVYLAFNELFLKDLSFPKSVVIAHACSSFRFSGMADSFLSRGAVAYLGWTDTITGDPFVRDVTAALIGGLLQPGTTLQQAYSLPAIRWEGWERAYSIDELYPVEWWVCEPPFGGCCFANGICGAQHASCAEGSKQPKRTTTDFRIAGSGDVVLNPGMKVFVAAQNRLFLVGVQGGDVELRGDFRVVSDETPLITDIAWDAQRQILWGISFDRLFRIDTRTAELQPVGSGFGVDDQMNALVVDGAGRLYAAGLGGIFMAVNSLSGRATAIGALGDDYRSSGDLAFLPDGRLVASVTAPGEQTDILVEVSLSTGRAKPIGPLGFSDVFGLFVSGDRLYGVTAGGELIVIDTTTGCGTFVRTLPFSAWGAQSVLTHGGR